MKTNTFTKLKFTVIVEGSLLKCGFKTHLVPLGVIIITELKMFNFPRPMLGIKFVCFDFLLNCKTV